MNTIEILVLIMVSYIFFSAVGNTWWLVNFAKSAKRTNNEFEAHMKRCWELSKNAEVIQQEPDSQVAKLETINKELCDALEEALKDQIRTAALAQLDKEWEVLELADKRIEMFQAVLAKARSNKS